MTALVPILTQAEIGRAMPRAALASLVGTVIRPVRWSAINGQMIYVHIAVPRSLEPGKSFECVLVCLNRQALAIASGLDAGQSVQATGRIEVDECDGNPALVLIVDTLTALDDPPAACDMKH